MLISFHTIEVNSQSKKFCVQVSMSYEDVAAILQDKLGNLVEMEPLVEEKRNKLKENEKDEEEINERLAELMADRTGNDKKPSTTPDDTISDLDYLVLWEEGDTLHPNIGKIKIVKGFQ